MNHVSSNANLSIFPAGRKKRVIEARNEGEASGNPVSLTLALSARS